MTGVVLPLPESPESLSRRIVFVKVGSYGASTPCFTERYKSPCLYSASAQIFNSRTRVRFRAPHSRAVVPLRGRTILTRFWTRFLRLLLVVLCPERFRSGSVQHSQEGVRRARGGGDLDVFPELNISRHTWSWTVKQENIQKRLSKCGFLSSEATCSARERIL